MCCIEPLLFFFGCFGCPEWASAATREWSFSVLRVWFHPWPWAHISGMLIQSWADNIRANAGQRFCGDLNTEEILAGNETSAEPQHRWGTPPPLCNGVPIFRFLVSSEACFRWCVGVVRVTVPRPAGMWQSFCQIYTLCARVRLCGRCPRIGLKKYYLFLIITKLQTRTGYDCKHVVFMKSNCFNSYFRELIFSVRIEALKPPWFPLGWTHPGLFAVHKSMCFMLTKAALHYGNWIYWTGLPRSMHNSVIVCFTIL